MPKATIVKVVSSTREIEKDMHATCKSRWFQSLFHNEYLDEELVDDEQKNEKRKNHKQ
jgi:hypothetical protein